LLLPLSTPSKSDERWEEKIAEVASVDLCFFFHSLTLNSKPEAKTVKEKVKSPKLLPCHKSSKRDLILLIAYFFYIPYFKAGLYKTI
jgi:hypothetical protein